MADSTGRATGLASIVFAALGDRAGGTRLARPIMPLALDPVRSASILGVQCSCSLVELRDRGLRERTTEAVEADRSLSPADIWTALIARVVSRPRSAFRRTHCWHTDTERPLPTCSVSPTLDFPRLSLARSPQKATRHPLRSIPGHPAGSRRARPVRHRTNRHRQDRRLRITNPPAPRRRSTASRTAHLPRPRAEPDA